MNTLLRQIDEQVRQHKIMRLYAELADALKDYDLLLEQRGASSIELQCSGWELFAVKDSQARFEKLMRLVKEHTNASSR